MVNLLRFFPSITFSMRTIVILELTPSCFMIFVILMIAFIFVEGFLDLKVEWTDNKKKKILTIIKFIFYLIGLTNACFVFVIGILGNQN